MLVRQGPSRVPSIRIVPTGRVAQAPAADPATSPQPRVPKIVIYFVTFGICLGIGPKILFPGYLLPGG